MLLKDGVLCSIAIPVDANLFETKANVASAPSAPSASIANNCLPVCGPSRGLLSRVRFFEVESIVADTPDGPDGTFQRRTHRDYSASGAVFACEGNFVTKRHQPVAYASQSR